MVDPNHPSLSPSPVRTLDSTKPQSAPAPQQPAAKPAMRRAAPKKPMNFSGMPFWMGLALSIVWVGVVAIALMQSGTTHTFGGLPLVNWAIGISAIASPVGMIWMVTAYLQRAADVQSVAEPLRRQLMMITGESGAAEVRIRRFNQAIREQLDLLRTTKDVNHDDMMTIMERVRQHKNELEQFEQHSVYQVKEIQDVIRHSMQHIEQLMEDKFTMLRILDGKLLQSGDGVSRQTEAVREQLSTLLQDIESNTQIVSTSLEQAMRDSKKLSDTARAQESSLINAAESASSTLQDLSGKIDINIAHFLERASTAREEAERLAGALDSQTRVLDEFSSTLPARVIEAETVLRGVADRLYASEQLAREQAVHLGDKLGEQIEGLQGVLDRFGVKIQDIDHGLQQRRSDLDGLVARIGDATDDLSQQLQGSLAHLGNRADDALKQFTAVNAEARRGADDIAAHLTETAAKYEAAALQLGTTSDEHKEKVRSITSEIGTQLSQFEALFNASQMAGQEVQTRAGSALQNLQHVLERLLATRDATQSVGETLTEKLRAAVDQNEVVITRINEAAQMTVHALGIATESLGRQEGAITGQAQAAETSLRGTIEQLQNQAKTAEQTMREQNLSLTSLLKETQERLDSADQRLKDFSSSAAIPVQQAVHEIEQCTTQGLESVGRYGENMQEQLTRLQQFNTRVNGMGEEVSRMTTETLNTIEQLNGRFLAARAAQEDSARSTIEQFGSVADRLQKEVGLLGGNTSQAVSILQQAASQVSQHSQQLQRDAEDSGTKIQIVTSALQTEAAQIRAVLQKQADDLNADLARAEQKFTILGESLKQRTDTAQALLDRMATHYGEMTRATADEFETRAAKLGQTAAQAQTNVETLNNVLQQQISLIGTGSTQLEATASQITGAGGKTLQQLSLLNEKLAVTQETTVNSAQQSVARIEEANNAFQRQSNGLNDAAQNAVIMIQKAGTAFGEQSTRMIDSTHQVEQNIRNLSAATTAFADQSTQIRAAMEQNNHRLVTSLSETVGQLDATTAKLQQAAATATLGADQASSRFHEMTQNASSRIGSTSQELLDIAAKADTTLNSLGASITQQVASLNLVGDQLSEQHRALTAANENQRTQLVDLFDKLGSAHGQASEVAERTITRLTDALQQIQRQLGVLSDQSQTTLANVRTAGTGFADQAGSLLQHAQQAEQQARTVLSVTSALQDQARQLRDALHGEGERTGEILGSLLGRISAGNSELRDLGATAEVTLTSLNNNVTQQTSALNSSMQQISDRQRGLTTALDAQRDVLNGLLNRLTLAQDETAAVAERSVNRLSDSTRQITEQIETIDSCAESSIASIRKVNAGFAEESATLASNAQQAEKQAQALFNNTATLQKEAVQLRASLDGESDRVTQALTALLQKLDGGNTQLIDLGTSAETMLTHLRGTVDAQTTALTGTMRQIDERQRVLNDTLDSQSTTLNGLLNRLTTAQDEATTVAERCAARLTDNILQIARQMDEIDTQANTTLANVHVAGARFGDESAALSQHAQQAEQQTQALFANVSMMQEQARQMRETIQSESDRTGLALDTILAKLTSGSKDLRDLGTTAEGTLTTLHGSVNEQTTALIASMQQISERQRALTSSLDQQRDTLNALLNRLALAQDETSAVAERNAARLTDNTQQITKQMVALESVAQNTLANVRAAGAGFVDEAGTLNIQAQQTEQQVRGMLSVTAAMQDQARQLRESMQGESSRVIEQLNGVVTQLDTTSQQLKQQSGSVINSMDQSVLQFSSLAKTTNETLEKQAEILAAVAEQAEARVASAGDKIRIHVKTVTEAGETTEQQARQLADTAEYATTRLVTLRDTMAASDRDGRAMLDQVSARIAEVKTTLQRELEHVAEVSQLAVEQVTAAGLDLTTQSDTLRANLASSESALVQAATLVRDESVQLPVVLDRSTARIEATGKTFKEQAGVIDYAILGTADRFINVTGAVRDSMMDEARNLEKVAETSDQTLRAFNKALAEQIDAIQLGGKKMSAEQTELVEKSAHSIAQLSASAERLAKLRDEAVQTTEKLAREFDVIDARTGATTQRLAQASEGVNKQITLLTETTERAEGQMLSASQSFREQLERIRTGVQMQIDDINRGLMQITAQLERTGTTLRSATAGTVADVEKIATRFDQTSKDTANQLSDRTARMRVATEEVAKLLSGFGDQIDVLLDRLSMAGDGIKRHESDLIGQLQTALGHLGSVAERLESNRVLTADVSDEAVARLSEVAHSVEKQMRGLTDGSKTVTEIVRGVGQMYADQTHSMNHAVVDAQTQVLQMNKSIEEMQQRTDRMRVALKLQGEDLLNSLEQILRQLSATGDVMGDTVDHVLQRQAEDSLKRIS